MTIVPLFGCLLLLMIVWLLIVERRVRLSLRYQPTTTQTVIPSCILHTNRRVNTVMRIPVDAPTGLAQIHLHLVGHLDNNTKMTITLVGLDMGPLIIGSGTSGTFTVDELVDVVVNASDQNNLLQLHLDLIGDDIQSSGSNSISDTLFLFRI